MKKMTFLSALLFCFLKMPFIFAEEKKTIVRNANNRSLMPPQYILQNQFQAAFDSKLGADQCIDVFGLVRTSMSSYTLEVHVKCKALEKAKALSTLLSKTHQFGGISVDVVVTADDFAIVPPSPFPSNTDHAQILLKDALLGNSYYQTLHQGNGIYQFFVMFKKSVIQYPSENGADAFGNTNVVAASLFYRVLGLEGLMKIMRIGTSTEQKQSTDLPGLSPPWYIFQNQMRAALDGKYGADPCVEVQNLVQISDFEYVLKIRKTCESIEKGKALSTILTTKENAPHRFSNVAVRVMVTDKNNEIIEPGKFPSGTNEATNLILDALSGNPYFVGFDKGNWIYKLFIEFKADVIQFRADNVADAHRNLNRTAADVFFEVLGLAKLSETILMGTSTEILRSR